MKRRKFTSISSLSIYLIAFLFIVSFNLFLYIPAISQCSELFGITAKGGKYDNGTIYKTDGNGNNYVVLKDFKRPTLGYSPKSDLFEASNNMFYGMTSSEGLNNGGILFGWDPITDDSIIIAEFDGIENGSKPLGNIIQAGNGKLYGLTSMGGIHNEGVLFEINPIDNSFIKKIDFDSINIGCHPNGSLVWSVYGKLFGMTLNGGANNMGVIFSYDPITDSCRKIIDLNGVEKGKFPYGSLVQANNDKLYGMTSAGGDNDLGVLFELDPSNNTFLKLINFNGAENGSNPHGSLIQAIDGKLYGMTVYGGENNDGVIFEYNLSASSLTKKIDFLNRERGMNPYGSLVQADNGKFYGMTCYGGWYGAGAAHGPFPGIGVMFEWDPVSNTYVKKIDFWSKDGFHPTGSLAKATNGKLYGMAGGGEFGGGLIFEWDTDSNAFKNRLSFRPSSADPHGSLMRARNGKIYGIYSGDGISSYGVLFEFDPVTNNYIKKYDFTKNEIGISSNNCLTEANNGKLYGLTYSGGDFNMGVLYEWDPVTNKYTKKLDFGEMKSGQNPYGTLTMANNGKLYGMTYYGGVNNYGVIFEWDPNTDKYTKKIDFDNIEKGKYPYGTLQLAKNGKFYGTTISGGIGNLGILFEWDPLTNIFTKKIDFNESIYIKSTEESLVVSDNGKIYWGGGYRIVEWDPLNNSVRKVKSPEMQSTYGTIIQSINGNIYGVSYFGSKYGLVYEWNPSSDSVINKIYFDGIKGSWPFSSLIEILNPMCNIVEACKNYISPSGKYIWNSTGDYCDTISSSTGTDSVIYIHLSILPESRSLLNVFSCGDYLSPSAKIWTTSGTYTDTIPNAVGCDSIITVNLTIKNSSTSSFNETVCDSYTSPSGKVWTISGEYKDTIPNASGCDSIITINLTVNHSTSGTIQPKACGSYTSPSSLYVWEQSGTYLDTIPNACGCDSIITVELNLQHIDPTVSLMLDGTEIVSNDTQAQHQWVDCNNNFKPLTGQTRLSFKPIKAGNYAVLVSYGWCADTSECIQVNTTGMEPNPAESGISVYPNPTTGKFTIDLGREYEEAFITITTIDGRLIQKKQIESVQQVDIDLTAPVGIYLVNVKTLNEFLNYRIVKK